MAEYIILGDAAMVAAGTLAGEGRIRTGLVVVVPPMTGGACSQLPK